MADMFAPDGGSSSVASRQRTARGRKVRTLLSVVLFIAPYVGANVVGLTAVVLSVVLSGGEQAGVLLAGVLYYGVFLATYGWLAGKVSYRWFDSFCALIPFYGYWWQYRIMWRVAYLPQRDWQPRPDEIDRRSEIGPVSAAERGRTRRVKVAIGGGEITFTRLPDGSVRATGRRFAGAPSREMLDRARRETNRHLAKRGEPAWF